MGAGGWCKRASACGWVVRAPGPQLALGWGERAHRTPRSSGGEGGAMERRGGADARGRAGERRHWAADRARPQSPRLLLLLLLIDSSIGSLDLWVPVALAGRHAGGSGACGATPQGGRPPPPPPALCCFTPALTSTAVARARGRPHGLGAAGRTAPPPGRRCCPPACARARVCGGGGRVAGVCRRLVGWLTGPRDKAAHSPTHTRALTCSWAGTCRHPLPACRWGTCLQGGLKRGGGGGGAVVVAAAVGVGWRPLAPSPARPPRPAHRLTRHPLVHVDQHHLAYHNCARHLALRGVCARVTRRADGRMDGPARKLHVLVHHPAHPLTHPLHTCASLISYV